MSNPMDISDERFWLEVVIENLQDADYCPFVDDETMFKIAAIQTMIERNETLETALSETYETVREIG